MKCWHIIYFALLHCIESLTVPRLRANFTLQFVIRLHLHAVRAGGSTGGATDTDVFVIDMASTLLQRISLPDNQNSQWFLHCTLGFVFPVRLEQSGSTTVPQVPAFHTVAAPQWGSWQMFTCLWQMMTVRVASLCKINVDLWWGFAKPRRHY